MSGVLHGVVASLKAAAATATDSFWKYVTLLLNTTSTNGAQNNTFLDSSTNNFTVTRNGDTTQGSFNPYMPIGYWSGFFDGAGDFLSIANNVTLQMGSGTFTLEAWVLRNASGAAHTIFAKGGASTGLVLGITSTNILRFTDTTTNIDSTGTIPVGVWTHVAAVREGTGTNQLKLYINGSNDGTGTSATNFTQTEQFQVGRDRSGTSDFNGYISNARVVKGTTVYTGNFTPSTTPLTAITNTSLLCLQDNRFKDNSTNAFAITVNGDTRISKLAPFNPPASYSTASYGGSGYFDGAGDFLTVPSSASFAYGTGDFTWEFWFYAQVNGGYILDHNSNGGTIFFDGTRLAYYNVTVGIGSVLYTTGFASNPALNTWHHVAAVRISGTTSLYFNGVRSASGADGHNYGSASVSIGQYGAGGLNFAGGYISNIRLVNGTAVYSGATLTVPTLPLTAITNTSLLLNFANAGIYDATTINDGQTVGNAQVSTTQAKWSPTSMSFDGTGDYVVIIDKPELRLGTGDFTIEGWVYLNATGVAYGLVSKGTATTGWSVNVTSGNKLQFSYTATQLTGATSLVSGTWYYFAVVRSGTASGNLRVVLNGTTDATSAGAVNDNFNQTNVLYVGSDRVAGAVLNGYLQDVRITNGYARTITTPTAAFPTL